MAAISVQIPETAVERLRELARREMRDPRSQASWLIIDGLARAGLEVDLARERSETVPGRPAR